MTEFTVPVPGGELAVLRWTNGTRPVLAVHGITGNALSWGPVARQATGVDLIAPDLRGRGHSHAVTGPYGLARHVADLLLVLDHIGITEPLVLLGHSMGGFIACLAAVRHPDRFSRLVLVDGGFPFPRAPGADPVTAMNDMIGPSLRKVELEFEAPGAYRDYIRTHPAFGPLWNDDVVAYTNRDLVGTAPHVRSSCVPEALRADGVEVIADPAAQAAIGRLPVPATLLWAERGASDESDGFYRAEQLATLPDTVDVRFVPGVNHYSIVMGQAGASAVVGAI
jgi:pimeloyl-ACP methyl ester carboxylesterase